MEWLSQKWMNDPRTVMFIEGTTSLEYETKTNIGGESRPFRPATSIHHSYDAANRAMRIDMFQGDKALPSSHQIRIDFTGVGPIEVTTPPPPETADMLTLTVEYFGSPNYISGGKMFDISNVLGQKQMETQMGTTPLDPAETTYNYLLKHHIRSYGDGIIGGNGGQTALSINPWASRNIQPPLNCPGRNNQWGTGALWSRDHVLNAGSPTETTTAFLSRPATWTKLIYTFDWRTIPYRFWMWVEDADTGRVAVLTEDPAIDPNAGFVRMWGTEQDPSVKNTIRVFWVPELNNSSTINVEDCYLLVRDILVIKDVFGANL